MTVRRIGLALAASLLVTARAADAATQALYRIDLGGTFQYFPSGFGPGIPGGSTNDYQLDFGIGGTFLYELDMTGPTARLLDFDLELTGNEAIQAAPPAFGVITADRVADYLASQQFVQDFVGGLLHLESTSDPALKLTDSLSGQLTLRGGYDARPVDGDAVQFQLTATVVPEPASCALAGAAAIALAAGRRWRFGPRMRDAGTM